MRINYESAHPLLATRGYLSCINMMVIKEVRVPRDVRTGFDIEIFFVFIKDTSLLLFFF